MATPPSTRRSLARRLLPGILAIAAFGLGLLAGGGAGQAPPGPEPGAASGPRPAVLWTCSMHPQIQLPRAGQCPICLMDLIPLESDDGDLGPRSLELSSAAAALAEIRTEPVARRPVEVPVRLIGRVAHDESRTRAISAWVPGRIDTLFVDRTGAVVRRGQRLVSLYSPELYAAQAELLHAAAAERELRRSADDLMRRTARATVAAARERLRLWGLTAEQVAALERRGAPSHHLPIRAPLGGIVVHKDALAGMYVQTGTRLYTVADLSRVWVILDAYESDLPWLREGQTVTFGVAALPGRTFGGAIAFISPVLDERTRTVEVRLDVDNGEGLLKPGMYVHAVARAAAATLGSPPLVIPASAPLLTGERAVVYVRRPDRERPTFEGREVVLGPRAGDHYVVVSGLAEGELVVVQGNFKLDSALQIQARPSMMNPGGGPAAEAPAASPATRPASAAFLDRLDALLGDYLEVQAALAADDDGAAASALERAGRALADLDTALLPGTAHRAWMQDRAALEAALADARAAGGIAARREAFRPLSSALWDVLRRFDFAGPRTVRLFHCPMAFDEGADWLQLEETVANPYYGAAMLRCGSQTDSLAVRARTGGGR